MRPQCVYLISGTEERDSDEGESTEEMTSGDSDNEG